MYVLYHSPFSQHARRVVSLLIEAKLDFELWSTAVSAINGCGMCLDSHEAELRKHGVSATQIQAALLIAAVVDAVSRVLQAQGE